MEMLCIQYLGYRENKKRAEEIQKKLCGDVFSNAFVYSEREK